MMKAFLKFAILLGALVQIGCQPICTKMNPAISCPYSTETIGAMPSAFAPLSPEEKESAWAKELLMGDHFAKEWDLYRALTCYKRALILIPCHLQARLQQIEYDILFAYYVGNKHCEVIKIFESSSLSQAAPDFPAFNQLLLIVYDSYLQTKMDEKADCVLQAIQKFSPDTQEDLLIYQSFKKGEEEELSILFASHRNGDEFNKRFGCYEMQKKSPQKAQFLNAILPGAGYYYVGEKKSAFTSFVINTLFTVASYQFFQRGYPAAGAITASLEMGWYLGGINGAGIEAAAYNARLFDAMGRKMLCDQKAFPLLMFETSF